MSVELQVYDDDDVVSVTVTQDVFGDGSDGINWQLYGASR